jgi:hypothetical protein
MRNLLICLALFGLALALTPIGEPHYHIRIPANDIFQTQLVADGFDVVFQDEQNMELIVSKENIASFPDARIISETGPLQSLVPTGYRNLAQINEYMHEQEKKHPNLAKVINIIEKYGPGKTHEGRPIFALKITEGANVEHDKPAILILSAHHCREIVTPEIALKTIETLVGAFGVDEALTKVMKENQIIIVPILNVDGLEYVWKTNRMWRKNRKPISGTFGIDLNRNYDLDWYRCGGSTDPRSDVYKGPSPFSEEETQTVRGLSRHYNFAKVMDLHSYGREVLHGYHPCSRMDTGLRTYIIERSRDLAMAAVYRLRDPSGNGQHQSWQIKEQTAYSFIVETHTTFQPTYASALDEIKRVMPMLEKFLKEPIPLHGNVLDAVTRKPLASNITIKNLQYFQNESRHSEGKYGRFQMFLPKGVHTFEFNKAGYQTETLTVDFNTPSQKRTVLLKPL